MPFISINLHKDFKQKPSQCGLSLTIYCLARSFVSFLSRQASFTHFTDQIP